MVNGKKLLAMTLAATLTASVAIPAQADQLSDEVMDESYPHGGAMIVDALVARPVQIAGTAIGAGLFVVSLPFSLVGGNSGAVLNTLVLGPAKSAFLRCLGCTPVQDQRLSAENRTRKEIRKAEKE